MPLPATEGLHRAATGLDDLPGAEIAMRLHRAQVAAAQSVAGATDAIAAGGALMAAAIRDGGRLVYAAAGSSGLMAAADALELPGTFGLRPDQIRILMAGGLPQEPDMPGHTEDDAEAARGDAADIGADDVVIALSASGTTPYALAVARIARERGAPTICIANNPGTPLLADATVAICLSTPPEMIAGSTRMGAGTAQKMALNMMSTVMGIALGHVHDGMMVNLRADNDKLRQRATGIIARISGVPDDRAQTYLATASGRVKPAVLLAAGAGSLDQAMRLLAASDGHLRPALARLKDRPSGHQHPNGRIT